MKNRLTLATPKVAYRNPRNEIMKKPELQTVTAKFKSIEFTSNEDETKRLIIKTDDGTVTLTDTQAVQLNNFMNAAANLNNSFYD
jgi:hypothetical protein